MAAIRDGHIGYRETGALLLVVLTTKVFLTFPRTLVLHGMSAAWMLPLLDLLTTLLLILPLLALMKNYPDYTLIEVAEEFSGPVGGIVVSLLLTTYFLANSVLILRQFSETVIAALLPATPISVITILFLSAVVFSCYQGIEGLTRSAWLLMPFILAGLVGVLGLVMPRANVDYLFPLWGPGPRQLLMNGVLNNSGLTEIALVSILNPYLRERGRVNLVVLGALALAGLCITLSIAVYLMTFSPISASRITYPLYSMARLIYYGRFFQRVESVFTFMWIFSMVVTVSALFYGAALSLARGLKLPIFRPLLFPLGVLVYALNFLIPNFIAALNLDTLILRTYTKEAFLVLTLLVWLLVKIRDKRGGQDGRLPAEDPG